MNLKGMIVSIVTAMLVMTMFASSAMAITVDGDGSDWNPDDKLCDDGDSEPAAPPGYNITSLWACIENGVFYARMDMFGVSGDGDGDGNDTTDTLYPGGDWPGVGDGAPTCQREQYFVEIDADNGGSSVDYVLRYCLGGSRLENSTGTIYGATTDAAHAGNTVELSVVLDEHCDIDPTGYCVYGWADTQTYGGEDNVGPVCRTDDPPDARFDFTPTTCGGGTLDASASSDDVEIVSWAWDFCDDGTGDYDDAYGESVSYSYTGTCNVGLKVTDNLGQTDTIRHDVTVSRGPTVQVTTDAGGCVELGSMVEFSIDSLTNDTPIASYQWTFDDGLTGSSDTSPTTSRTIPTQDGVAATLTVVDTLGCVGADSVSVCVKPPQEVPLLTLPGLLALIGMMCIVGAGRILTKGRRS